MKKYMLFIVSLVVIVLSCNNEENTTSDTFYEDYYNENIYTSLTDFKQEVDNQIHFTEAFQQNATADNFKKLQNQWLVTVKSYAKMSVYNIVPIKSRFYDILIYNFSISPEQIEINIEEKETFNSDYFSTKSTTTKGLGTVEYLLFNDQNKDLAFLLLQNNSFRMDYLLSVNQNILEQTNALIDFWEIDYKEIFINATNTSCSENARCLAFNQLINIIDVIRVTKVGKPAGLESSSNTAVKTLEAYRSENSLILIKSTLEEIQNAYSLSTINFSRIVNEISSSTEISAAIDTSFTSIFNNIDSFDTSLYNAILNNDPKVKVLYDSLFGLVKYFSVDAASILSVSVLPTDNDGD